MAVENGTKWRIYERMERKSDHRGGACGAARAGVVCIRHESGIQMYTECRDTALAIGQEQEIEAVKMFYRWQEAGELFQNEDTVY